MERRVRERFVVRRFGLDRGRGRSAPYRVVNVSGSGCALESGALLEEQGGHTCVDLPLPSKTRGLTLEARVVWVRRMDNKGVASPFVLGLCFEGMDPLSRKILDAYLDFLRRDEHIARLEEAWEKLKKLQEKIEVMIACKERKGISLLH